MPFLTDSRIDLARPGVVWLEGEAVPVERTGAERAVARLAFTETEKAPVIATLFGEECGHAPSMAGTLVTGGKRRKDSLESIDRWYRREARDRIELVVANESVRLGLHPEKVTIRDQKTRWGSCSTSGTLSFNWRLVIGPHHALRYVVIHELVHLEHHNHSRRFWNALAAALPDWKRSAQWLRSNERALTAYRPKI